GKHRRNRIADLHILLGSVALEEVVVRKRLQASRLYHREAPALFQVRMDVIVPIIGDMAGHRRRGLVMELDPEAVRESAFKPVLVLRGQRSEEMPLLGRMTVVFPERGCEQR